MPTTKQSHPIGIKIYNIDNQLLEGATVTLTIGINTITETSNSKGEVILNVANAGSWSVGDKVTLTANKTGSGTKTSTLVLTSSPQQTSLTLEKTSDLIYYEQSETDTYVLNFALLTDYAGNKITRSNPLPVESQSPILEEPAIENTYDSKNRLSTQTITVKGTQYLRTFTYTGTGFQFTSRTAWIKN